MKRVLSSTTCIVSVFASAAALAQATAPTPDVLGRGPVVEEIVVSATRSPQPLYRIGSSVTLLDAEAIKVTQSVVVSDLLAQTPGVSVSRAGGVGGTTSFRIRGAETDQSVVVIDGVKLNDPSSTGGGYNFANLLTGDVERIEVLRGAQSTLWGSQAIGGVVSIITAEPVKPLEASVEVEGGSRGTGYVRGGAGGTTDRAMWRVAGSYFTTDGASAFVLGKEDDSYRNTGLTGRFRFDATDAVSLDVRGVYSKGRTEFDGFPAPAFAFADTREYGFTEEFVGYGGVNFDLMEGRFKSRVAYAYTDTNRDNVNPDQAVTTATFDAAGQNKRLEYQGTFAISETWNAVFGVENEKSNMRTASPTATVPSPVPTAANVEITSEYAQVQGEVFKGLTLTGGVRHDDHDTFGSRTLGQGAAAFAFNEGNTVVRASFGQGFKAPTLFQLYSNFGNITLRPEEADSWDAGVEQRFADGMITMSGTWFQRHTKNQIDFLSCPNVSPLCIPGRTGVYANTARTEAQGVELAASARIAGLTVEGNYTLTDTENTSPGNVNRGKTLARRPKNAANFSASYAWPIDITTSATVRYVGDTFDTASNTFVLQDYTLVDLRVAWAINPSVEVFGRVENLFDKIYATTRNYGSPRRGAFAGVRANF